MKSHSIDQLAQPGSLTLPKALRRGCGEPLTCLLQTNAALVLSSVFDPVSVNAVARRIEALLAAELGEGTV